MKPFSAPLDDILFSLNHVAGADRIDGWDAEFAAEIGGHFASFAEAVIAPTDAVGDEEGARLENGRVRMPQAFRDVYDRYREQGWTGLTIPEEFGGQGQGGVMLAIVSEIFTGANVTLQMVTSLAPGCARTILAFGTDAQKTRNLPPIASGEWLSTMCLTEPGAGSDLGRIRTRAVAHGDGRHAITGEKIFISGGDHDLTDHIIHLVLARTGDDPIRGLSLFIVRSERDDGTRNAVTVARIEDKMGMHASPTCNLIFDGAEAELLGAEGQGLAAMFTMMNHARLDVGLQGAGLAARAHDIAAHYAAGRVQGRGQTIDSHADVRRMLDMMDVLAVGGRGIVHLAAVMLETGENPDLVELLTPVAKVFGTEGATQAADLGIQVLGGYGYLREYRMEQVARDARITRIYEGTNGIHALALATRLLKLRAPLDALDVFASGHGAPVADVLAAWRAARAHLESLDDTTPLATAFMGLTAELVHQCVWARIADAADAHGEPERMRRLAAVARRRVPVAVAAFRAEADQ